MFDSKYVFAFVLFFPGSINSAPASHSDCNLVKSDHEIDWNRLNGRWFETVKSASISLPGCYGINEVRSMKDGGIMLLIDYHLENKTYGVIPAYLQRNSEGQYRVFDNWDSELAKDVKDTTTDAENMSKYYSKMTTYEDHAVFTDYENYILLLRCGEHNEKAVWLSTPDQHPSVESIVLARNRLASMEYGWNSVPLVLSECKDAGDLTKFVME